MGDVVTVAFLVGAALVTLLAAFCGIGMLWVVIAGFFDAMKG
jgi:hypothetical protein